MLYFELSILLANFFWVHTIEMNNICFNINTPDLNLNMEISDLDKAEISFKIDLKIKANKQPRNELNRCLSYANVALETRAPTTITTENQADAFQCHKKYDDEICITKRVLLSLVNNVVMQDEIRLIGKKIVVKQFCSNLSRLYLYNNLLIYFKQIAPKAFEGLDRLKILNLSNNELTSIQTSVFTQFRRLVELDLSYNNIFQMEHDAFTGFLSLNHLNLMGNHLSSFNESYLFELKNLTRLNVKQNNIPLKNVRKLRMFYNLEVIY